MKIHTLRTQSLILFILLSLFFGVQAITVQAQSDDEVTVSLQADNETVSVGDIITLTLDVTTPEGYQVTMPQIEKQWGDFEVYSSTAPNISTNEDGSQTVQSQYTVTLFSSGSFETPPAVVTIRDANGNTYEKAIPAVTVTVSSVLTPEDTELRDIKPQADVPGLSPWLWILPGLAAAALLYWLAKRFLLPLFHKENKVREEIIIDDRAAHQIAFEELDRIEERKLLQNGKVIEYYSQVADCLRRYLEKLLSIHVMDRTTTELNQMLKQTELPREKANQFINLFYESDLVKFARFQPDSERIAHLVDYARQLIQQTKPADTALEEDNQRSHHVRSL